MPPADRDNTTDHADRTDRTVDYYNQHSREFIIRTVDIDLHGKVYATVLAAMDEQYPQSPHQLAVQVNKKLVLDAGCGSGRDVLFFKQNNCSVIRILFIRKESPLL